MDKRTKQQIIEELAKWQTDTNHRRRDGYVFLRDQLKAVGHWKAKPRGDGGSFERLAKYNWQEVKNQRKRDSFDQTNDYYNS